MTVADLVGFNNIKNPDLIRVGQVIKLEKPRVHTVAKGDTLSKIALKYDTTVGKLVNKNNIKDPDLINVGQVIKL